MRITVLLLCLSAASSLAAEKEKLLVVDFELGAPELKQSATTLAEQLLTEFAKTGRFEVLGSSDVALMLGMERQKALLGCSADTSCLAELGGALGAPWMVSGALSRAGSVYRLDLKLLDTRKAKVQARVGRTVNSQEELVRLVSSMAAELLEPIQGASSGPSPRLFPWVVLGVGVAAAGAGTGLMLGASADANALVASKSTTTWKVFEPQTRPIQGMHTAGIVLVGVGAAAAVGGLIWALVGSAAPTPVQVAVGPGGVVVGGVW